MGPCDRVRWLARGSGGRATDASLRAGRLLDRQTGSAAGAGLHSDHVKIVDGPRRRSAHSRTRSSTAASPSAVISSASH